MDEPSRKMPLGVLQQSIAEVEAPVETIWRMIMSVGLHPSCWRF
jgi:hypothetical protein